MSLPSSLTPQTAGADDSDIKPNLSDARVNRLQQNQKYSVTTTQGPSEPECPLSRPVPTPFGPSGRKSPRRALDSGVPAG